MVVDVNEKGYTATMTDQSHEYVITMLKAGQQIRRSTATNRPNAETLIEAFIEHTTINDRVHWESDMVNRAGKVRGITTAGVEFDITVEPPLGTKLEELA